MLPGVPAVCDCVWLPTVMVVAELEASWLAELPMECRVLAGTGPSAHQFVYVCGNPSGLAWPEERTTS